MTVSIGSPAELQQVMRSPYQLSEQQWAAVSAPLEPAVVVAGAGSGKTSLMAARVVHLVATGQVAPDEVLGLTFTTKATAELAGRIRESLEAAGLGRGIGEDGAPERLEPTVATYNAYAASLLAEHGLRIGHEPDTRVMADASRYQLAARVVDRHRRPVRELSDSPAHVIDYLLQLDSAMSEHLVGPDEVRAFQHRQRPLFDAALAEELAGKGRRTWLDPVTDVLTKMTQREELLDLVVEYRALKQQLGLMDFSDQIALAARLVDDHPDVGTAERARFRVVLLDEYQDTSVAQARMLSALFSGPAVVSGRGHPVTAVGDPNQAIYGWRGASVSNILEFGSWFPSADGRPVPTYPLTVNRRSDVRILEVANRLATPLYAAFDQVQPLEPKPGAELGEVRTAVHETLADELAWLPDRVLAVREEMAEPSWREIGVLTRDNSTAAEVFDALTAREIPVEIVGLQGLLRLPEVAEVVASLSLLHDLTANADLLTLLNGPRWAIGPRDLALLGRRARELAGGGPLRAGAGSVGDSLARAVEGADPTELVSLCDALDDPGGAPYSPEARERFALLSAELRMLRGHVGEPLLDLVRRIIDTSGLDVELDSSVSPAAAARRDNLDLFVKAVADFQAIDGSVTLPALLAYLATEDEMGTGLDVATPSEADSVKLLTVHRAKGLEWDAVFLVGVCEEKFPTSKTRSQWPSKCSVLPSALRGDRADVPQLRGHDKAALEQLRKDARDHEQQEELRLGYVAFTRARHLLSVSSHVWRADRKTPLGPSPFQQVVREQLLDWGLQPDSWIDRPAKGTPNPLDEVPVSVAWPVTERTREVELRLAAASRVRAVDPTADDEGLDMVETARVQEWDDELDRLLAEARADRADAVEVPLPSSLSATAMARLRDDAAAFARELARPMPRPPSPAARFGTRFHAWVEARFGQQGLIDPDELPGRADEGIGDEADLRKLVEAFETGPFAERAPFRLEAPFALVLAGQVVRGRIDAVYAEPDGSWLVVDWKTNRRHDADPLQLAIYRVAWAELARVPVSQVRAAFYYVRDAELVEPSSLPDRAELVRLVTG
ncbi:MAG TPA: ATP-dependent DNA helicase [Marmoricola sp.]|nr:ATP-dependent DNA helicase [Marmoricola sp.]